MDASLQSSFYGMESPGPSWRDLLTPDAREAVSGDRGGMILMTGHPGLFSLGHYLMAGRLLHQESVILVDGANIIDPTFILRLLRGFAVDPRSVLERLHLSRAFTAHQLEALVCERLEEASTRFASRLCLVSGLLDTLSDAEVPLREASGMLRRIVARLRDLADQGRRVVILAPDPPGASAERRALARPAAAAADRVFRLCDTGGRFALREETNTAGIGRRTAAELRRPMPRRPPR